MSLNVHKNDPEYIFRFPFQKWWPRIAEKRTMRIHVYVRLRPPYIQKKV